ncbi:ImmA/IrrE family metallo-endopeptidase [Paenibacillus sp. GCM10027627]|uniref:ImmA/IrrE family metallo-endopeptidase n=1 Tax=unclassified Paenibacillus TaxID=185978 RepID=UPI00364481D2
MDNLIKKLIRQHRTNCPFTIASNLDINIWFEDLGEHTRGFYYRKLRRRYIAIHSELSDEWKRFICAHELAHDRLHPGLSRFFLDEQSFFNPGKLERQANKFAVKLLTSNDQLLVGEKVSDLLIRNNVPKDMHKFYY